MTQEPNQPREHVLPAGQSERQRGGRERTGDGGEQLRRAENGGAENLEGQGRHQ